MSAELGTTEAILGKLRLGALSDDTPPGQPSGFTGQLGTSRSRPGGFALGAVGSAAPPPGPVTHAVEAIGGLILGGEAELEIIPSGTIPVEAIGGLILGGEADLVLVVSPGAGGGLVLGGEADLAVVTAAGTLEAVGGLVLGGEAALEVIEPLAGAGGLILGGEADLAIEHVVRIDAILELESTASIAQDHHLRASAILELVSHEGYIGPGSGLQTGPPAPLDRMLREGDTFPVFYRWAGLEGLSGIAHVMARTVRSDRDRQILRVQNIFPDDPALDRPLARGETPSVRPAENTIIRTIKRQRRREREGDG